MDIKAKKRSGVARTMVCVSMCTEQRDLVFIMVFFGESRIQPVAAEVL